MKQMQRQLLKLSFVGIMGGWLLCTLPGCASEKGPEFINDMEVSEISIPATFDVVSGGSITFGGKGFKVGDKILLILATDEQETCLANVTSVTTTSVTFALPDVVNTGKYKLVLVRGDKTLSLGVATLNIIANFDVPDVLGMNIKGVVYSNGTGIPGVVVSDGYEVTVTDNDGVYYLASEKKTGYVFISVPRGYEVTNTVNAPQFFERLGGINVVDRRDFSLLQVDNDSHILLAMPDMHLANRNNDLSQFGQFLEDVNTLITDYTAAGKKVYGLTLGDQTWDLYWYENLFNLVSYVPWMNQINCTVFNTMGNHDNDPYCANDWTAEQAYRDVLGPTWYSFNLGKVHYVVLDNMEYTNAGGASGKVGDRNYNNKIITDQIEWLKKDLATITDKNTPVVVAMHVPLYKMPDINNSVSVNLVNTQEFVDCLAGFTNVHVLSGHTHVNYSVVPSTSLMEHNIAAVCATWWWTGKSGYAGNHICKDGSVGGYAVWEINDANLEWYYKSIGYDKNYQFRTYDLNTILITADKYASSANATNAEKLAGYAGIYASPSGNNEVLINVWGYDKDWTVEVSEGAAPLTVTRVSQKDPLHIISYEAKRLNVNAEPTSSFVTGNTSHLFKMTASSPTTTLNIKVTDRFGHVYTETMTRPKNFDYGMK
ncbi:MAG: calcineurin-like phosphoesterase family protein [Prevotellaceae bacterium]|jgi:hypothetical protein|nr:calcineurin-like phosphoesterase family protein [Prevotellaceae bacterium]